MERVDFAIKSDVRRILKWRFLRFIIVTPSEIETKAGVLITHFCTSHRHCARRQLEFLLIIIAVSLIQGEINQSIDQS